MGFKDLLIYTIYTVVMSIAFQGLIDIYYKKLKFVKGYNGPGHYKGKPELVWRAFVIMFCFTFPIVILGKIFSLHPVDGFLYLIFLIFLTIISWFLAIYLRQNSKRLRSNKINS